MYVYNPPHKKQKKTLNCPQSCKAADSLLGHNPLVVKCCTELSIKKKSPFSCLFSDVAKKQKQTNKTNKVTQKIVKL